MKYLYWLIAFPSLTICLENLLNTNQLVNKRILETIDVDIQRKDDKSRCPCLQKSQVNAIMERLNKTKYFDELQRTHRFGVGCYPHDLNSSICKELNHSCDLSMFNKKTCDKSWCQNSWCFVDPNNCDLNSLESTIFEGIFYSYATCGYMNFFTNPFNITEVRGNTYRVAYTHNSGGWIGAYNLEGSFAVNDQWTGPLVQVLNKASTLAGFHIQTTRPPEKLRNRSQEFFDSKSSFDYCVYAVALGYIDFCISGYTITKKRTNVTPFFQAFTNDVYLVVFLNNEKETWKSFIDYFGKVFQPFTFSSWMTILLLLFIFCINMLFVEYNERGSAFQREITILGKDEDEEIVHRERVALVTLVSNSLYRSILAVFHYSYNQRVVTLGGKINLLAIASFILIITAIYTANLVVILTDDIRRISVNTIDEALHQGFNFCASRNVGVYIAELHNFDMNLIVPDPEDLGGDGKPGFTCSKCNSRTRVFEHMRRSHSSPDLYCNAAFVYEQDIDLLHSHGKFCDIVKVAKLGKTGVGIPISSKAFKGLSSVLHKLSFDGVIEATFLEHAPESQCPKVKRSNSSLSVNQLSGVWIFCLLFSIAALLVRTFRIIFRKTPKYQSNLINFDQWGNKL